MVVLSRAGVISVSSAIILAWTYVFARRRRGRPGEPPLEAGVVPFIGVGFEFLSDFQALMLRLRQKHGPVFTIINFGQRMTFVTDMAAIRRIWAMPREFSFDDFGLAADAHLAGLDFAEVAASGVGSPTLALHAKEMRGTEPLEDLALRFRGALESLSQVPAFAANASHGGNEWQASDLMDFSGILVWFAGGRSLFGSEWCRGADVAQTYSQYAAFSEHAPLIAAGMPKLLTAKGQTARDAIAHKVVLPAVKAILASKEDANAAADSAGESHPESAHPYLAKYIKALSAAHPDMEKVARRLIGLLFAAMTNTMGLMYWTLLRLATLPEDDRMAIRHEVTEQMGDPSRPYAEVKPGMPLLRSLLLETLRAHSDPNSFRVVEENCTVGGLVQDVELTFRKGDQMFLLSSFDQMSPNADVGEPSRFQAQRWHAYTSDAAKGQQFLPVPPTQVLVPFGGGKHLCPGRFFAMLEVELAIAWVIAHFDIEVSADAKLPPKFVDLAAPINMPRAAFPIRYRRRVCGISSQAEQGIDFQ